MTPTSYYSSYQIKNETNKNDNDKYNDDNDDDDDLDALRKAALKTLNSKKRKVCFFLAVTQTQKRKSIEIAFFFLVLFYRIVAINHQFITIFDHYQDQRLHDQVVVILLLVNPIRPRHYRRLARIH